MNRSRLYTFAVLAVGAILGWAAASGKFNLPISVASDEASESAASPPVENATDPLPSCRVSCYNSSLNTPHP